MFNPIKYENLYSADHGWLKARHHFSFGDYYDPARMSFGKIRVINDDLIGPQKGFPLHPHKEMEIITFVRRGAITHSDDQGNKGRTAAGDIQVMSAGTGIRHSEYNLENEETNIYQIWIEPRVTGITPRWETKSLPDVPVSGEAHLLVSGYETDAAPLTINADARIFGGKITAGNSVNLKPGKAGYLLVSAGKVNAGGHDLEKGDAAEIVDEPSLSVTATEAAEILFIELMAH